jgi:hypothetical protein
MKIVAITPDRKLDYLVSTVIHGLQELKIEIIASDIGNGIQKAYTDDEVVWHAKNADFIFVFFGKVKGNKPPKRYLLNRMGDIKNKLVYLEDSEWTCTAYPLPGQVEASLSDPLKRRGKPWLDEDMMQKCNWYFKHSCYPEDAARGVIPFQIGVERNMIAPPTEKNIDLLCSFGQTANGLRAGVLDICRKIGKLTSYNVVTESGLSREKYLDILSRSRIAVDAWGGSENNPRTTEGMANGCCMFYQRYTTLMMHQFTDFVDTVSYSTLEEFEERMMMMLADRDKSIKIGETAREQALHLHVPSARVQYLFERLCKV